MFLFAVYYPFCLHFLPSVVFFHPTSSHLFFNHFWSVSLPLFLTAVCCLLFLETILLYLFFLCFNFRWLFCFFLLFSFRLLVLLFEPKRNQWWKGKREWTSETGGTSEKWCSCFVWNTDKESIPEKNRCSMNVTDFYSEDSRKNKKNRKWLSNINKGIASTKVK